MSRFCGSLRKVTDKITKMWLKFGYSNNNLMSDDILLKYT